jgi:hypothetical protein
MVLEAITETAASSTPVTSALIEETPSCTVASYLAYRVLAVTTQLLLSLYSNRLIRFDSFDSIHSIVRVPTKALNAS